jgi:hypothetical protein
MPAGVVGGRLAWGWIEQLRHAWRLKVKQVAAG